MLLPFLISVLLEFCYSDLYESLKLSENNLIWYKD